MVQPPRSLAALAWSTAILTPFSVPPPMAASPPLVGSSLATVTCPTQLSSGPLPVLLPPPPLLVDVPQAARATREMTPRTGTTRAWWRSIGSPLTGRRAGGGSPPAALLIARLFPPPVTRGP